MKKIKAKHIPIILLILILLVVASAILFSPFMFSNGTFLTKREVKRFDLSYTLGDANSCGLDRKDIYLLDFSLKRKSSVVYEEIYDEASGNSALVKSDFKKIFPGIWRLHNDESVRVFAYERGDKRYYFLYKSM